MDLGVAGRTGGTCSGGVEILLLQIQWLHWLDPSPELRQAWEGRRLFPGVGQWGSPAIRMTLEVPASAINGSAPSVCVIIDAGSMVLLPQRSTCCHASSPGSAPLQAMALMTNVHLYLMPGCWALFNLNICIYMCIQIYRGLSSFPMNALIDYNYK